MPWYWCSNLYEWGNYVKAESYKEAKKLYYIYGDEPGEWINIRCRKLKEGKYDEEWLERYLDRTGVISRPPACNVCGHQYPKPEHMKKCPCFYESNSWY